MSRRCALRVASGLLITTLLFTCQGCTTAMLWDWAGDRESAGELQGVWRDDKRGDVVVYALPTDPGGGTVYWAFRVPPDWHMQDVSVLVESPRGDMLTLTEPLQLATYGFPAPDRSRMNSINLIDYTSTLGPVEVALPHNGRLYGLVELINYRDEMIHEVYGYDAGRQQWVMLTSVNLGAYDVAAGRVAGGLLLTPLTMTFDVAVFAGVVCLMIGSRGRGFSSVNFGDGDSDDEAEPPTFAQRFEYWQSVGAAAPPAN